MKMKKIKSIGLSLIMFTLLASSTTLAPDAPAWNIDKAHSSLSFSVNHFFTPVNGHFKEFQTQLRLDPENLSGSYAEVVVKVASVNTGQAKRDKHLQSGDFFDAGTFPEIKFESSKFSKTDDGYLVTGFLTIRDVKKEVEIPFMILGISEHPMKKGKLITAIQGEITLNRNDYGVGSGSWAATAVVGDEVDIAIILEANRDS